MKFSLMVTCLGDVLRPEAGKATVRLLRRLGHDVEFRDAQTCCGQPFYNSGFSDLARQQARHTIEVFEGAEVVVVPSGSCAAMVKVEYPHLLEGDEAWHRRAVELSGRTFELTDLLVNYLKVVDVGARFDGKVTYHYACHLRGLGLHDEAVKLIEHVAGATYVPLRHEEQCCGFGGSFAVRYGHISTAMVDDKTKCIVETDADAVVSTDAGCLMNIGGRLRRKGEAVRVMHLAELLAGE
ncbi:MAG TPA: (Fe-S)-binding protein [Pirellulales bacterium]|nr:(Fe-S)-binding protein [Pirellulales bacterium]